MGTRRAGVSVGGGCGSCWPVLGRHGAAQGVCGFVEGAVQALFFFVEVAAEEIAYVGGLGGHG